MLRLELPIVPVAKGASVTGNLVYDGDPAIALQLEVEFPPHLFDVPTFQPGRGLRQADVMETGPSSGARGLVRVLIESADGLSGSVEVLRFTTTARGRRGSESPVRAYLLSGVDADLIPIDSSSVEALLSVASGAVGVATTALASGHAQSAYHAALLAEGGHPPYHWTVSAGSLPPGLTLSAGGEISGTPPTAGTSTATFEVADSAQPAAGRATQVITLDVSAPLPEISTDALPSASPGHPYSVPLTARGGRAPLRWSAQHLPVGLSIVGDRIAGTPAVAATLGEHTVALTVEDASTPPLSAAREVRLVVVPFAKVADAAIAGADQVCVAPNLLVAEYEVAGEVEVVVTGGLGSGEAREGLDRALDDVMSQIVASDCLDIDLPPSRPNAPGRPGVTDPLDRGTPGRAPVSSFGCRDRLLPLLEEYRNLRNARQQATVFSKGLVVTIDGQVVLEYLDFPGSFPRRMAPLRAAVRSDQARALAKALATDRPVLIKHARSRLERLIKDRAAQKAKAVVRRRSWRNGDPVLDLVDQRLSRIEDLLGHFDWDPPAAPARRTVTIPLTTGPHRVGVSAFAHFLVAPGSTLGAFGAQTASVTSTVKLRPRNPERWPRLEGEVVCRGSGVNQEHDVNLHPASVDVLVSGRDGLSLVPATGNPATPYGRPRPFQRQPLRAPKIIHAGVVDDIGRTWVIVASDADVWVIANGGVGGFRPAVDLPAVGAGPMRAVNLLETGQSHAAIAVLGDREVGIISDLERLATGGTAIAQVAPIHSRVVHDEAAAFCPVPAADTAMVAPALIVAWRHSGFVTWHPISGGVPAGAGLPLAPFDEVCLPRRVVALACRLENGHAVVSAVARESREVVVWSFTDRARPGSASAVVSALHVDPLGLVPAGDDGHALLLGPVGQVFFRSAANLLPIEVAPGTHTIHGRAGVLALARPGVNELLVFERRSGGR